MDCPICGQSNLAEARFCGRCGSPLASGTSPSLSSPRAPALAMVYAGFGRRLAAWVVDLVVVEVGASFLTLLLAAGSPLGGRGLALVGFSYLTTIVLPPLYYVLMTGLWGQTLGKMALSIRVVNQEGHAPGIGRAALRETIGKFVSAIVFFLGFLWVLRDARKQGWHDKIAGTYVMMTR